MTPRIATRSVYVTGTDTGAGKTLASTALLHALRGHRLRAVGMKPVASGCTHGADGWRNDDALALQAASDPRPAYADLNPFALPDPLAPELAAREAGIPVTLPPLLAAHARLAAQADAVVVEGVGGWMAPLSGDLMQADLARALDLPVVLVVGLRLGCLNHAYATARAIAADGLRLAYPRPAGGGCPTRRTRTRSRWPAASRCPDAGHFPVQGLTSGTRDGRVEC